MTKLVFWKGTDSKIIFKIRKRFSFDEIEFHTRLKQNQKTHDLF